MAFETNAVQKTLGLSQLKKGQVVRYENAVDHRDFDIEMYRDIKEMSPIFQNTVDDGESKLKTFSNLSEDIFLNLFKWNPQIREVGDLMPSRYFNHGLLNELNQTEEFQNLREKCRVNMMNSAIGAEIIQTEALRRIDDIIYEYRQRLRQAQQQGTAAPDDIMGKINDLVNQEQNGSTPIPPDPNDPYGSGSVGGQGIDQQLAQQLAQAQSQLAQSQAGQDMQQQVQEAMKQAAKQALDDVREMDEFMQSWGIEPGGDSRVTVDECKKALERIRSSEKLKELSKILGQFRSIAKSNLKQKSKGEGGVLKDVKTGNDVVRMLPSEKGLMSNKATKALFRKKFSEKQCLQYEVENRKRKGMGPIVIAIDSSGSMDGDRIAWAKAVALALLEVATKQKRNTYIYFFDTVIKKNRTWVFEKGNAKPNDIIDIAEVGASGGTNFQKPVDKAMEIIAKEKGFKKADITFITDGDCSLYEEKEEELIKQKKAKNVKIQTIIINMGGHCSMAGVENWSDSVRKVSSLADLDGSLASDIFNITMDDGSDDSGN